MKKLLQKTYANGDNLMITFDDGFFSNRDIAEKILNPMGIQALFFVVSDFVNIDDHDEAKDTFHHFVRKFVDQYSTTNPGSKYNA